MKKISPEAVNKIIEECKTEEESEILIPRTPTYREDVYLDYDSFIDKQVDIEDMIRQTLPFFSKNLDKDFPLSFFMCTGERSDNHDFKKWTQNYDDVGRLVLLAMYSGIVSAPKKVASKDAYGNPVHFMTHKLKKALKPVVVKEEPKAMTKTKEPEEK